MLQTKPEEMSRWNEFDQNVAFIITTVVFDVWEPFFLKTENTSLFSWFPSLFPVITKVLYNVSLLYQFLSFFLSFYFFSTSYFFGFFYLSCEGPVAFFHSPLSTYVSDAHMNTEASPDSEVGQYVKIFQPTCISPITDDRWYIRAGDFLMDVM